MGKVLWLTGLPCAGKTTIAEAYAKCTGALHLDGDVLRKSYVSSGTGFSPSARRGHLLRVAEIARMYVEKGDVVCSLISPSRSVRKAVSEIIGDNFNEIYISTSQQTCEKRDVKGMYAKARAGELPNFTGVDGNYDIPENPVLSLNTDLLSLPECVDALIKLTAVKKQPASMFIGRWNGVFHNGHMAIIKQELDKGKNVLLAVRDVEPDEKNPWTAVEVKELLDFVFKHYPVQTIIIPDIESVNYGRDVGYEVKEIVAPKDMQHISGTACRKLIEDKQEFDLSLLVPERVIDFMRRKYA